MEIRDANVPCSVLKTHVLNHSDIKGEILSAIATLGIHSVVMDHEKISNTDWHINPNLNGSFKNKKYVDLVRPIIDSHNVAVQQKLQLEFCDVNRIWFQQYLAGDFHGWHVHGRCMFSNVYYVELPSSTSKTTFRHFGQEFVIDVEEGDILTFPSFLQHCSKPSNSESRKTIIAFNTDFEGCNPQI